MINIDGKVNAKFLVTDWTANYKFGIDFEAQLPVGVQLRKYIKNHQKLSFRNKHLII